MANQTFYLAIKKAKYGSLNGRITKKATALGSDERLIKLSISVPDSIFSTPQLAAKIEIPASAVNAPVIDSTVVSNIQELVKQNLGVEMKISIVEPFNPENEG